MIRILFATALLAGWFFTYPGLAQGLPPKIFLASTGADTNDGSRASPKRSLQAGHDTVAAGGELVILDTAGYGAITITKSVAIVVPPGVTGFVTVTSTSGTGVNINAAFSDVVVLRGLIIEGTGPDGTGVGISANRVGTLSVENTTIRNFQFGIRQNPDASSQLTMRGGAIRDTKYGVYLQESSSYPVQINAIITDVEMSRNETVFRTFSTNNPGYSHARLIATRCAISQSTATVFDSYGVGAQTTADGNTIMNTSRLYTAANSATNYTRGNNTIQTNGSTGDAPTPLAGR